MDHDANLSAEASVSADWELESASGYLARRFNHQLHTFWNSAGPELTIPQFSVLLELDRGPDLDQRTLGQNVWIDSSTMTDVCRRLIERGYIQRRRDPEDRRRYLLELTATGREVLREALPKVSAVNELLLARLTTQERGRLIKLLQHAIGIKGR